MHDETITTGESEQTTESASTSCAHLYYELGNDLLSKPNALCDLIEHEGVPSTLVFCNQPSDADFVDVMLKKRGIIARKLIGNVPQSKVLATLDQVKTREVNVLVVTDIAAKNIDVGQFALIVNYGMTSDPEVYIERVTPIGPSSQNVKVISLVTPLDLGNFHYVKKYVEFDFVQGQLPDNSQLANIRVKTLEKTACDAYVAIDSSVKDFVEAVESSSHKKELIAYLLNNTLNVLPGLTSNSNTTIERTERSGGYDDDRRGDRGGDDRRRDGRRGGDRGGDRVDRGSGDRGSGDRGDRNGGGRYDRGPRRGGDSYESRGGYRNDDRYSDEGAPRNEGRGSDSRGDEGRGEDSNFGDDQPRNGAGRRGGRDQRERRPAPKKDARVYIGHGLRDGLNETRFREIVETKVGADKAQIQRITIRDRYGFVDFPEGATEELLQELEGTELSPGNPLFLARAAVVNAISAPGSNNEGDDQEAPRQQRFTDDDSEESFDDEQRGGDEGEE